MEETPVSSSPSLPSSLPDSSFTQETSEQDVSLPLASSPGLVPRQIRYILLEMEKLKDRNASLELALLEASTNASTFPDPSSPASPSASSPVTLHRSALAVDLASQSTLVQHLQREIKRCREEMDRAESEALQREKVLRGELRDAKARIQETEARASEWKARYRSANDAKSSISEEAVDLRMRLRDEKLHKHSGRKYVLEDRQFLIDAKRVLEEELLLLRGKLSLIVKSLPSFHHRLHRSYKKSKQMRLGILSCLSTRFLVNGSDYSVDELMQMSVDSISDDMVQSLNLVDKTIFELSPVSSARSSSRNVNSPQSTDTFRDHSSRPSSSRDLSARKIAFSVDSDVPRSPTSRDSPSTLTPRSRASTPLRVDSDTLPSSPSTSRSISVSLRSSPSPHASLGKDNSILDEAEVFQNSPNVHIMCEDIDALMQRLDAECAFSEEEALGWTRIEGLMRHWGEELSQATLQSLDDFRALRVTIATLQEERTAFLEELDHVHRQLKTTKQLAQSLEKERDRYQDRAHAREQDLLRIRSAHDADLATIRFDEAKLRGHLEESIERYRKQVEDIRSELQRCQRDLVKNERQMHETAYREQSESISKLRQSEISVESLQQELDVLRRKSSDEIHELRHQASTLLSELSECKQALRAQKEENEQLLQLVDEGSRRDEEMSVMISTCENLLEERDHLQDLLAKETHEHDEDIDRCTEIVHSLKKTIHQLQRGHLEQIDKDLTSSKSIEKIFTYGRWLRTRKRRDPKKQTSSSASSSRRSSPRSSRPISPTSDKTVSSTLQ